MFSKRLAWPPRENRLAALLREKRAAGAPLVDLTESNPTRAGLAAPPGALAAALGAAESATYDP
ncbi:MAG TPA: hypothetical protein VMQ62_09785, partial [Dongiaceae bacterium]|nr:hypothetical protein [Dongiaceae bacterium]